MSGKDCPSCGNEIEEWFSYCATCGYHLAAGPSAMLHNERWPCKYPDVQQPSRFRISVNQYAKQLEASEQQMRDLLKKMKEEGHIIVQDSVLVETEDTLISNTQIKVAKRGQT